LSSWGLTTPTPPAAAAPGASQSEFARRAANIGLGIHSTSQKLQKLAQLARRTSMFDDPAEEINELSTVVKQDIQVRLAAWQGLPCCLGPGAATAVVLCKALAALLTGSRLSVCMLVPVGAGWCQLVAAHIDQGQQHLLCKPHTHFV
jgi:hypothetical protein